MGKTTRNSKRKRSNRNPTIKKSPPSELPESSVSHHRSSDPVPLSFPPSQPLPKKGFLQNVKPYGSSFQRALETSYEGFAQDVPKSCVSSNEKELFEHEAIQRALLTMDSHGFFRTDVTQPFGLGTKCAKTYVTRCLLGDEGNTYKYLGLRMFAHPWNTLEKDHGEAETQNDDNAVVAEAKKTIRNLNESLTKRTVHHLDELNEKRQTRGAPLTRGRAKYDVTLINRMENSPDLKIEPTTGEGKCSVSWHADSSLENFSSIAVYHSILSDTHTKQRAKLKEDHTTDQMSTRWSVALRVAHNSEGPGASRRGAAMDSSVVADTPPIAVSMPSGSAYYLLDDFNHHHQHAVLINNEDGEDNTTGIRFASTHRLLREGHNITFIIERCRVTCSQFHKKGPKIWRSEQLLLTEIESEWIRQFYVQGEGHKKLLWETWKEPICTLLKYWTKLEVRTKQVLDLLSLASQERCSMNGTISSTMMPLSRDQKKIRDKKRKALAAMENILNRTHGLNASDIYISVSELIEGRAMMRLQWAERENDRVFKRMNGDYKPIKVPLLFKIESNDRQDEAGSSPLPGSAEELSRIDEAGSSPLPGSAEYLSQIAEDLKKYGTAFLTKNTACLPQSKHATKNYSEEGSGKVEDKRRVSAVTPKTLDSFELKSEDWVGWSNIDVGLEMQDPWGNLLLNGAKTIETRAYSIPTALIGKKIEILQSKPGNDGVSAVENSLSGEEEIERAVHNIGFVIFDRVVLYRYKAKFQSDESKHLVSRNSGYAWKSDTDVIYGWVVKKVFKYEKHDSSQKKKIVRLERRMRSLYEISSEKRVEKKSFDRNGSRHVATNRHKRKKKRF